jgi:transposase
MEATGVYWKPVQHVLEGHFELVLANAAHVKKVPGRKTDVNEAMWLADLLAHGLIRASFVPPAAVQELRVLTRTRKQFVRERGAHVQRIERVLEDANLKLGFVLTDTMGKSGRAVLQAIVNGQTDPERLLSCIGRVKASRAELLEALRGRISAHHRFVLKVHLGHIDALDQAIATIEKEVGVGLEPFRQAAKLLSTMPGLSSVSAHVVVAEIGMDMSRFATPGHLLSWACMCPRKDESAGKRRAPDCAAAASGSRLRSCKLPGPPSRSRAAICKPSSTACAPGAAPRKRSSPWPPRCLQLPGTCCATARSGTTWVPPTSTAPTPPRPPAD